MRSLKTLVKYVLKHGVVYFSGSPRISWKEWEALDAAGYKMQSEHGLHEDHCAYPLNTKAFREKAERELGIK